MVVKLKALILSCNTGEGHNTAGRAIYAELCRRNITCEFVDALSFASENISNRISKCYTSITTKLPRIFSVLYKVGDYISSPKHKSPIFYLNNLYQDKLLEYIYANNFDYVITPHLFPAQTLTSLINNRDLHIKTIAIATDYTCIPFWEETNLMYYVIPHKNLMTEFLTKGLPKDRLLPFGIPVDSSFSKVNNKMIARKELGLDPEGKYYLIMSGSMGFGDLTSFVKYFNSNTPNTCIQLIVLCGRNKKLLNKLNQTHNENRKIHLIPYTNQVALYMDAADVLFTKPGGLTSTEAAVKNIPIIHTKPIPGCETRNAEFFYKYGMSFYSNKVETQLALANRIISNQDLHDDMIKAQRKHINAHASSDICDYIMAH